MNNSSFDLMSYCSLTKKKKKIQVIERLLEPLFLVSLSIIEYFAFNYTIGNALTYGIKLSIPCLVLGRNKVVRSMSPK